MTETVIPILVILAAVTIAGLLIYGLLKLTGLMRPLAGLVSRLDQSRYGPFVSHKPVIREFQGVMFECLYRAAMRYHQRSSFSIRTDCRPGGKFEIVRESFVDRFFKALGFSREIQTGDSMFDRDFYILTDTGNEALRYLEDPAKREAIRELFRMGFNRIRFSEESIEALQILVRSRNLKTGLVEEGIRQLHRLTQNLPTSAATATGGLPPLKGGIPRVFVLAPIILVGFGSIFFYWSVIEFRILEGLPLDSLKYSLPLTGLMILLIGFFVRGRSRSHRVLGTIALCSIFAVPMIGFSLHVTLNAVLDRSKPVTQILEIAQKKIRHGRRRNSYYVFVPYWPNGDGIRLQIDWNDFDRLSPHKSRVRIVTQKGYFRHEWLVSYSIQH